MTFPQAIQSGFKNYVKFDGRATRSEYWWFTLFYFLVMVVPYVMMFGETSRGQAGLFTALYWLLALGFFLPLLGLGFRRLHDTNRSAWWMLIALVPVIGGIVLLVFYCMPSTPGPNKYGSLDSAKTIAETFS